MPITVAATLMPSGEGTVKMNFLDGSGAPTPLTGLSPNDEDQRLAIVGSPAGYASPLTYHLGYGGQATAALTAAVGPQPNFAQWNLAGLAAGTYDLAVNVPFFSGGNSASVSYEFFDGTTFLRSGTISHNSASANPGAFDDPSGLATLGGPVVRWYPVGSDVAVSSGTLRVRVSCPADGLYFLFDCLRVANHAGGALVRRVQPDGTCTTSALTADADSHPLAGNDGRPATDTSEPITMRGSGVGPCYVLSPADVQAKLQALSAVGAGNLTVGGGGTVVSPLTLTFVGALAERALPLVTSDAPALAVSRASGGAIFPAIVKNGGTPIPVPHSWVWWDADPGKQRMDSLLIVPPRDAPAVCYSVVNQYENTLTGPVDQVMERPGFTGQTRRATGNGVVATYRIGGGPAGSEFLGGTFRVSATWHADPGNTTAATFTLRDLAGNTLATITVDQTHAPSGFADNGVTWQDIAASVALAGESVGLIVTQAGGAGLLCDAVRFERLSAPAALTFAPSDVVSLSWGQGFATCAAGPVPAGSTVAVNLVGGQTYPEPTPDQARAMPVGYNLSSMDQAIGSFPYANLAAASGITAYPTSASAGSLLYSVINPFITFDADRKSWPSVPPGKYILRWKGASACSLEAVYTQGVIAAIPDARNVFPAPAGSYNVQVYQFSGDAYSYGPAVNLRVNPTGPGSGGVRPYDFSALGIYADGTDLANPPKFHPEHVARLTGTPSKRLMNIMGAIEGNGVDFADFLGDPSRLSKNAPTRVVTATVTRLEAYTGGTYNFPAPFGIPIRVTAPAHGFAQYQKCILSGYSGSDLMLSDGLTFSSKGNSLDGYGTTVWRLDADHFVLFVPPHGSLTVANVVTPASMSATVTVSSGKIPLADVLELANGLSISLMIETPFTCTASAADPTSCVYMLGNYLGQHLAAGLVVRHECSNETWNFGNTPYQVASTGSYLFYGGTADSSTEFTCEMAKVHFAAFRAGWVAAGRNAADHIRVMGVNGFDGATSQSRAAYCHAHGIPIDEVAPAAYLNNSPCFNNDGQATMAPIARRMTVGQSVDLLERNLTEGRWQDYAPGVLANFTGYPEFGHVKAIFYEGGPQAGAPMVNGQPLPHAVRLGHGVWRHPRTRGILRRVYALESDSGVVVSHDFEYSGDDRPDGAGWPAFLRTDQPSYAPGNPAQDAIQVDQFDRTDLVHSIVGGAIRSWNALAGTAPAPTPTPPPTPSPSGATAGPRPRARFLNLRAR